MIEELILHIGAPKTGTTALQLALTRQRQELLAQGIYFPATGLLGDAGVPVNLQDLAGYAADADRIIGLRVRRGLLGEAALQPYRQKVRGGLADIVDAVEQAVCPRLLLSAEGLYDHLRRPEELERLAELVKPIASRLRILLWLRRQDQYLLSRVSQAAKGGTATVAERCRVDEDYDYAARLERWRRTFPDASLTVLPYRGDTLPDFCRAVGLPEDFLKAASQPVNTSLTPWAIAVMAVVEPQVPLQLPDGRRNPRWDRVMAKVRELARAKPDDRLTLTLSARRRLMLAVEAGNSSLAELYNQGRPLFDLSDLGPRDEWGGLEPVSAGESLLDALNLPPVDSMDLASLARGSAQSGSGRLAVNGCSRLLLLNALKLSGANPLMTWLKPQLGGVLVKDLIPVSPMLRSQSTSPYPVDFRQWCARKGLGTAATDRRPLLVSLEDQELGLRPFDGVEVPLRQILLLRHPEGLFLDRLRKAFSVDDLAFPRNAGPLLERVVGLWKQYAREYLGHTRSLPGRLAVYFDRWYEDVAYRRAVSEALGLAFDDQAFSQVGIGWPGRLSGLNEDFKTGALGASLQSDARELLERVMSDSELQALSAAVSGSDPFVCLNG